jgi:hypothetical protein
LGHPSGNEGCVEQINFEREILKKKKNSAQIFETGKIIFPDFKSAKKKNLKNASQLENV